MRVFPITAVLICLLTASCMQMNQEAVGPIPPPSPETLVRPLPPEWEQYYTLPVPVNN